MKLIRWKLYSEAFYQSTGYQTIIKKHNYLLTFLCFQSVEKFLNLLMTTSAYNRIKTLLIEQKRQVTSSSQAASQLITDLGIRDILVTAPSRKGVPKKAAAKKAAPKKAAAR